MGSRDFAIRCAAKVGEQLWSEMRRPSSISFMQEDKEESQHCASLLVTQHCGVACCPLIVVSLLLLAAADDGHVFDLVFSTFPSVSRWTSEQNKTDAFIFSNDLT